MPKYIFRSGRVDRKEAFCFFFFDRPANKKLRTTKRTGVEDVGGGVAGWKRYIAGFGVAGTRTSISDPPKQAAAGRTRIEINSSAPKE